MSKRKHSAVSFEFKLNVLKRLDKGECARKIAQECGIGKSTIGDWKKNRVNIEAWCSKIVDQNSLKTRSSIKSSDNKELDEALFVWFTQERERGTPISGPLVQQKALDLNKKIAGQSTFSASNGWLDRWKKRHGIRQLTICGEKLSANSEAVTSYQEKLFKIIQEEDLSAVQVYNCDETGLNFKMLPNKTLASRNESHAPGYKASKERLTVLACSNASGCHKMPLMVIGKSKKPRAFKNINIQALPVYYRAQKKAWMDSILFKEWFNNEFVPSVSNHLDRNSLPRRAILILDNAPSHPSELKCGEIRTIFLPPNVTALIQPMDQGVLENIKRRYRKQLLVSLLEASDIGVSITEQLKIINIKQVIYWVATAWENITANTIVKSWKKLWPEVEGNIIDNNFQKAVSGMGEGVELDDALDCANAFFNIFKSLEGCQDVDVENVNEWLVADKDPGYQIFTDDEIVSEVTGVKDFSDEESDDNAIEDAKVSHGDAMAAFDIALKYVEQNNSATTTDIMLIKRWRDIAAFNRRSSLRQSTLKDFFSKKSE